MILNHSFILLGLALLVWFIICRDEWKKHKRMLTKARILKHLGSSFEVILGLYAILYAVAIIVFNAVGLPATFPQDNAALTAALLYGGVHMMYPTILILFPRRN